MEIFDRPLSSDYEYRSNLTLLGTSHSPRGEKVDTVDLLSILEKLWSRKWRIFALIIVCGGLAYVMAKVITPSYIGTALIIMKSQETIAGLSDAIVPAGVQASAEVMTTESFVLQSRALAIDTIERLHLDRDPEFDPLPNRFPSLFAPVLPLFYKMQNWLRPISGLLSSAFPPPAANDEIDATVEPSAAAKPRTIVVNAFLERLRVTVQESSNVLEVSFRSSRPKIAALVPNTLIQIYLEQRSNGKERALARENEWLDSLLPKLGDKMRQSELALADYRQKSGLTSDKNSTLFGQDLAGTKAQLALARARTAEVSARFRQMQALATSSEQPASTGGAASPASASESPALQRLREQQIQVQEELTAIKGTLGPKHPKTVKLEAQLRDLSSEIGRETAGRLKAELAAAQAAESVLLKKVAEFTQEYSQANGGDSRLQTLIAQADADRKTYDQYLARANDVHSRIGHEKPDGSLLSSADVPLNPSFPNTKILVAAGSTIGAGVGVLLATIFDWLRGRLRSKEQVEEAFGIRCLGLVPRLKPSRRRHGTGLARVARAASLVEPKNAVFRQSVRSIGLKLRSFDSCSEPQVVLVSSALPQEGKTWMAVSLAASLVSDGFRVALIDCDLHRPKVHRMFDGLRGPGLTDYLSGSVGFDEIIHQDRVSGVDYVPAGGAFLKEARRMAPDRVRRVIDLLGKQYAFIIVDSAPVLAVPETLVLSRMAHKTIFVARWGRTPVKIARHALMQLLEAGAETAVVLSMVDLKRAAMYGDPIASVYKRLEGY
jgi:succinoglycan biosynthesis transport protein ExoP